MDMISTLKGSCFIYVICVHLRIVVSNTYCVVFFVLLVFVLCRVYCGIQHTLCCVFACFPLVSCVWWYPTHIVLYFCLFSSCVWWYPTHIVLCFCFDGLRLVICVHIVTNFSGLSIIECPEIYVRRKLV